MQQYQRFIAEQKAKMENLESFEAQQVRQRGLQQQMSTPNTTPQRVPASSSAPTQQQISSSPKVASSTPSPVITQPQQFIQQQVMQTQNPIIHNQAHAQESQTQHYGNNQVMQQQTNIQQPSQSAGMNTQHQHHQQASQNPPQVINYHKFYSIKK